MNAEIDCKLCGPKFKTRNLYVHYLHNHIYEVHELIKKFNDDVILDKIVSTVCACFSKENEDLHHKNCFEGCICTKEIVNL